MISEEKIKELEVEIERLRKLVYFDELTSIYNRRGFLEAAGRAFLTLTYGRPGEIIDDGAHFGIIFLDIDNFKSVNDTYGHDIGDEVLKLVAKTAKETVREVDIVGRWGGEEIVIALVGTDPKTAPIVAERLRKNITKIKIPNVDSVFSASLGLVSYTQQGTLNEMISQADSAMYKAKTLGKNKVVIG